MKCPNCGAEMAEGSLYCEQCGEDIHIVPDFEPEFDYHLSQTLNNLLTETDGGPEDGGSGPPGGGEFPVEISPWTEKRRKKKTVMIVCGSLAGLLLTVGLAAAILVWQYHSYDFQIDRARLCVEEKRYDSAVRYYGRALELNDRDVEVQFELAEAYALKGNKIEYEYVLREMIRNSSGSEEQLERAYGKLIAIYRAKNEYDTINQILQACSSDKIKTKYQDYMANEPDYSYLEGFYTEIIPLKLSAAAPGKIYYTLDESEPDADSPLYTAPIFLEDGDYVVKAVFINDYGVASPVVSKEFHVSVELAKAPEISVISGDYSIPMMIEVYDDEGDVYYTTDGTVPSANSTQYTGPIPMPFGKSQFKFAHVEDGAVSEIAEREFRLTLNTELSPEDAESIIVEYMLYTQKIYNYQGEFSTDSAGQYKYQCQYAVSIGGAGDFYVIAEIYKDEAGMLARTGSYYAVDIYTGKYFKLQVDENGNYNLVEILIDSQEG